MGHPFICIAGKNNIAVDVLEYVIRQYGKESICIVCNKTETGENTFQRSFRRFALQNGIAEKTLEDVYEIDNLLCLWSLIGLLDHTCSEMQGYITFIFRCFQSTRECTRRHILF